MKLNLGCGGIYKKGYLNIDAFDNTVADKITSVTDLEIEENSVDEILASQVIEHLGILSSIYSLSECFRVLKPKGKLFIETPDINKSFKTYIEGNREDRKNILPWIFGLENPGLQHKFCFPNDLLEETCRNIGFVDIKSEYIEFDKYQPILKLTCIKPIKYQNHQLITQFRKQLLHNKIVNLKNQILGLEQEKLIDLFSSKIKQLNTKNKTIEEITIEGTVCCPEITKCFLEILIEKGVFPNKIVNRYLEMINILIESDFLSILCYCMREIPNMAGEQERLYQIIVDLGKITSKNLLDNPKKILTIESIKKTKNKCKSYDKIDLFSEKMLLKKSNKFFQKGAKEFILKKYDKAIEYFKLSNGFYRNQILSYWNLGRLYSLKKELKQSNKYYKTTQELIELLDCTNKENIKQMLGEEVLKIGKKQFNDPIICLK